MNKNMAPPEANQFRVMLELKGAASGDDRPGVDIVAVLDVSGSMKEERLQKLKTAMRILINKLHPMDRLSVITFSKQGMFIKKTQLQMYSLHLMTEAAQKNVENLINGLQHVDDAPSIAAGLQNALQVLNARDDTNRTAAIMLMYSDRDLGHDNGDAMQVPLGDVPLYKFTFAHEHEADGLNTIGNSNKGGTFPLADVDDLDVAFSQCLTELCDIVIEDLKLTFTPTTINVDDVEMTPKIKKVYAGNCQQSSDDSKGSVTVSIPGELYSGEIRKIMADLLLPAVSKQMTTDVLQITHSYTVEGKRFDGLPLNVDVIRTRKLLEETKIITDDNHGQNTGNTLLKHGQDLFKGAFNAFTTRNSKEEHSLTSEGENSDVTSTDNTNEVPLKETNSEGPTTILPDISRLQGAGKYVLKQGQGAGEYVIQKGQKVLQSEKLPDSDPLKGAAKYVIEQGQGASKYVAKQGQKFLKSEKLPDSTDQLKGASRYVIEHGHDAGKFVFCEGQKIIKSWIGGGVNYNKENPNIPPEVPSQTVERVEEKDMVLPGSESEALKQVMIDPKIDDLKEQILTAIQYFNTIQQNLKSIQDAVSKASTEMR